MDPKKEGGPQLYSLWPPGVTGPGGSQHSPTRRDSGRVSPTKEVSVGNSPRVELLWTSGDTIASAGHLTWLLDLGLQYIL